MRQLCKIIDNPFEYKKVLDSILKKFQSYRFEAEVLLQDQKNDKSHQYHSYIIALLIDIKYLFEFRSYTGPYQCWYKISCKSTI